MSFLIFSFFFAANFELSEWTLVRDIIYVLQGIEGKYIKSESNNEGYTIDPKVSVSYGEKLVHHLA